MRQEIIDVLVVGAGPTGLALASELRRRGIRPMLLDRLAAGQNTSRAAVVHARTLEVLEALDVTRELIASGAIVPTFRIRERSRVLAAISFKDLETAYPFTLMCPQNRMESILLNRLQALGGAVIRPCEVLTAKEYQSFVEVSYLQDGAQHVVRAKWVVGCDGGHSVVREQAGIAFEGDTYEETFILADVEMDWPLDREEVSLFFSKQGLMVVAPLPDNRFRIVATVQQTEEQPPFEDFQNVLNERGPDGSLCPIRSILWSSRFKVAHRVASEFHKGHFLLAGDAAHVHSPAGGQGMNTGIQDGISLAEALHTTLTADDQTSLVEWQNNRRKIAQGVVQITDRMTRMATISSPILKQFRNGLIAVIGHIPLAQHALAETLSELKNR
ncbi:MAG: FAD-dependent monooxygenase [Acidobacteriota bacterium]|nr:FAD-dependent monooxygenase [Acidobacteriota bacterium]